MSVDDKNLPTLMDSEDYPYFEEGNEYALGNLLPDKIAEYFSRVPEEWINIAEKQLKKLCYPEQWSPTLDDRMKSHYDHDSQLRYAFWLEYDLVVNQSSKNSAPPKKMRMQAVTRDICSPAYFQNIVAQDPKRAAWILKPPGNYNAKIQALMWMGQESRFNILSLPIVHNICSCRKRCVHGFKVLAKFNGRCEHCPCASKCGCPPTVDTKLADLQQKVADAVELRAKGAIPLKSLNLNLNKHEGLPPGSKSDTPDALPSTPEDIELELKKLRGEIERIGGGGQNTNPGDIIDVSPKKDS